MRLAVSNLAWKLEDTPKALRTLKASGVSGVEVAPTRIAEWDVLSDKMLQDYRRDIENAGLVVSSLQAVLFGKPDAILLGNEAGFRRMLDHVKYVADIAEALGARVLVFGAPRNRSRGAMAEPEALALGRERLSYMGDILLGSSVVIGIEPVPEIYGGDFLTSAQEVIDMVTAVGHPNVGVHLDTGCVKLGGGSIADAIGAAGTKLCHFHAAEPNLGNFSAPAMDHEAAGRALHAGGYRRWVAIEMREAASDALKAVEQAVRWVHRAYDLPAHPVQ